MSWLFNLPRRRSKEEDAIRPRTKSERQAFSAGYAQAMIDINERGWKDARDFLKTIAESDR